MKALITIAFMCLIGCATPEPAPCYTAEECAARRAMALQMMQTYMQNQAAQAPSPQTYRAPTYQQARPIQTECRSDGYGTVNCTSKPTGVDTSIYGR